MADKFTPPKSAKEKAALALKWREEHPNEIRGMTQTGWTRARQLAKGEALSRDVVGRMAQFIRHEQNFEKAKKKPEFTTKPWTLPAVVAWYGWGGYGGIMWAKAIMKRLKAQERVDALAQRVDAAKMIRKDSLDHADLANRIERLRLRARNLAVLNTTNEYYEPATVLVSGVDVAVIKPKGSYCDERGMTMQCHYGMANGVHECYVGDNWRGRARYQVEATNEFTPVLMLGFNDILEARRAFEAHDDRQLRRIVPVQSQTKTVSI